MALRFDDAPLTIAGHYRLGPTGLTVKGTPDFDAHLACGEFIRRAYLRSPWWLADWLRYGDNRADWADRIEQAQELTGLARQTLLNLRTLARVDPAQRRADVELDLYYPISGLPAAVQDEILDQAQAEGWGRREVREEVRVRQRAATVEGQATLEGQYRVFLADCPWLYGQAQPSGQQQQPALQAHVDRRPLRAAGEGARHQGCRPGVLGAGSAALRLARPPRCPDRLGLHVQGAGGLGQGEAARAGSTPRAASNCS